MLYLGNFSYTDINDEDDNYCLMPAVVDAPDTDTALARFEELLRRLHDTSELLLCLVKSPFRKCASISLGCGHVTFSDFVTPTRQCLSAADARDGATPLRGHHGVAPIVVRTGALLTPLPRRVHRG